MENLVMLGTGAAFSTECYPLCFAIEEEKGILLVDGGGGNGILRQLKGAGIAPDRIHDIFLSQSAPESLFGVLWVIRMIGERMRANQYKGELRIYCPGEMIQTVHTLANATLPRRFVWLFDHRILFVPLYDRDERHMMGHEVQFFSMEKQAGQQMGFAMTMGDGSRLVFAGKGLLPEYCFPFAQGAGWLIHEAYCLYSQKDLYQPYESGRCTVREACETAAMLGIPRLILSHTEDDNLARRRELYQAEARLYYNGNVLVPGDLERILLCR